MSELLIPIVVAIILIGGLALLSRPGVGGKVGELVRQSDHAAWQDAVEEKRRELQELIDAEPRQ